MPSYQTSGTYFEQLLHVTVYQIPLVGLFGYLEFMVEKEELAAA